METKDSGSATNVHPANDKSNENSKTKSDYGADNDEVEEVMEELLDESDWETEEVDKSKLIEPTEENVPPYNFDSDDDSDYDIKNHKGRPLYKVDNDPPTDSDEDYDDDEDPEHDPHAAKRDPKYLDTLDLSDEECDPDLDRVDFGPFLDDVPPDFTFMSDPRGLAEDYRAIPVNIVSREEWGAQDMPDDLEGLEPIDLKVPYLHIEYHTETEPCFTKEDCIRTVKEIQRRHIEELGLPDLKYNFLIGGDGNVYEGRGWHLQPDKGDELPQYHGRYYEFVFIGDYRESIEPVAQNKCQWGLIGEGMEKKCLYEDFDIIYKYKELKFKEVERPEDL